MSPHQADLHAGRMRERRDPPRRKGAPASFFRRDRRRRRDLTPEERGLRDGLADAHCLPQLQFITAEDWLRWMCGWRRGQEHLRRRDFASQGFSFRGLENRQLPLFPGKNRQVPSSTGGPHAVKKS